VDDDLAKRSFLKTYTLTNIKAELAHRIANIRQRRRQRAPTEEVSRYNDAHALRVGQFYDARHEQFMSTYGPVIQAYRTTDINDLLNYQIESIGLAAGQRVLDAGCGVGAPAVHFARHVDITVDAITVSRTQHAAACQRVSDANLSERVRIVHGDYHRLADYYGEGAYDVVYFLESFGHSAAKPHLLDACWRILKPGGVLYIKDLFRRLSVRPDDQLRIDREIRKINEAYRYQVSELNDVLDIVRARGYLLSSLKSVDIDLQAFEDLAISNQFQELTGIALIDDWDAYVFPVDFFELRCTKPDFDVDERLDRHFSQNQLAALRE